MTEGRPNTPARLTGDDNVRDEDRGVGEARDEEPRDEDLLDELGVLSGTETGRGEEGNLNRVTGSDDENLRDGHETSSMELGPGGEESLAQVSVTVDDEHLESMDQVVHALKERGMRVDDVLESLGLVTGSTPDASALREVEGVSGVDTQLEHQIAPPEDEVQ